ncbi:flavin monoamine oxidase family protein [Streptomyces sp. AS02]|uniref:flavin monoamine oxidase family protein n=1 Tax=Streptomyces sp. AS02 TaxID=2938946 RepID=UPI002022705A|nr:flavin monoamine oxidase family protein [Streptomyces sp. AS02]MCL8014941.1 flavin monoamine oxidase family protein [Streptomyces sp. AS02]
MSVSGSHHGDAPSQVDAVVIGAGLSGLAAARALRQRGASVVVLEAADQVGGRVRSAEVAGAHIDLGGTFVGPGQDRVIALADELGVDRFPTYESGDNVIRWRGLTKRYRGTIPPVGTANLLDVARIRASLEKLSRRVPEGRPWDAPGAAALDARTLGSWLRERRATEATYALMAMVCRTSWGCEPSELSLLHVLHYVRLSGGLDSMLDTKGGAQEEHFLQGSQEIALRIAAELGDRVRTGAAVTAVDWSDGGVVVRTGQGATAARHVVVAVPPAMRRRIAFTPELPHGYSMLSQRWPPGVLSKAYAVYAEPFWRRAGLTGQALSDTGPAFITFDAGPPDASLGVLLGFVGGMYAQQWDDLPEAERRARVLSSFADLFGPEALEPIGYMDQRWATETWLGGGPTAAPGPGGVAPYAPYLTRGVGPIHWAGTETADRWTGFMDGAVRAGERAAREIFRSLTAGGPHTNTPAPIGEPA